MSDYGQIRFRRLILIIMLVALVLFIKYKNGERRAYAGIPEPIQTEAEGQTKIYVDDYDVTIDYLYAYDIEALVIGTKKYSEWDIAGKLAPKDLGLAWGDVAAYNDVIDFHWRQSGRWLNWHVDSMEEISEVGGVADVNRQSSNNHVIAADTDVRSTIAKIRRGDHVHLKGYLISLKGVSSEGNTYTWVSSTSRTDSGAHACEVFYVTDARILD
ncbi:MAG: hypothetical protein K5662_03890 [Lachnospiraceae bacterium]|nr:hypothetical protein [Lachnospiraceae bacterium]